MTSGRRRLVITVPRRLCTAPPGGEIRRSSLQKLADHINARAANGPMLGQIEARPDGKTRIHLVSHSVLPTARVVAERLLVDIEPLDTEAGRNLSALFDAKLPLEGLIYGVGSSVDDVMISGIDVTLDPSHHRTVLDDIVDSLIDAEDEEGS